MANSTDGNDRPRFAVFRAKNAVPEDEMTAMTYEPVSPAVAEHGQKLQDAGARLGSELKLLFAVPGMSLAYVWFKSGYLLPRHSHNADCLYYIVGGSLKLGTEELGPGDGFYVGADVPYAYTAGPEGVEVLEFRTSDTFNIKVMVDNPAFWQRALETVQSHRGVWANEARPAAVMPSN